MPTPEDLKWMQHALGLARKAAEQGEVPVGAVVICDHRVVGEGCNSPITACDPTAHAEIRALRAAAETVGNYRLPNCVLYVTLEPCTMCVGAIVHARVKRLVFAAREPKAGVVGSNGNLLEAAYFNHRLDWEGGVCADEAADILQGFFRHRRALKKQSKDSDGRE